MLRIGLIGAGALAHVFCQNFEAVLGQDCRICGLFSRTESRARELAAAHGIPVLPSLEALLAARPDYVVELAGVAALKAHAAAVLRSGASLIAVSAGALADPAFKAAAQEAALQGRSQLLIPNGAIAALDLMQACSLMGGVQLEFESRKAPKSLNGAPGLHGRTLSGEHEEIAFEGSIAEAIQDFPKNVNVAVAAAAASGASSARMVLRSDPKAASTTHRIRLQNALVSAEITVSARPDPANPRSSVSTAWSVLALLKSRIAPIAYF